MAFKLFPSNVGLRVGREMAANWQMEICRASHFPDRTPDAAGQWLGLNVIGKQTGATRRMQTFVNFNLLESLPRSVVGEQSSAKSKLTDGNFQEPDVWSSAFTRRGQKPAK